MYWAEGHIAAKDGGEPPVIDCPECGEASYVVPVGSCALCDFSVPEDAECVMWGRRSHLRIISKHTVSAATMRMSQSENEIGKSMRISVHGYKVWATDTDHG